MPDRNNGLFDSVNEYNCCFTPSRPTSTIIGSDDGCSMKMGPSPETDTTPKAPDKPRHHHHQSSIKDKNKDDKTLSNLNEGELKGLLEEAITYKNPKDRVGKSKLFNNLLNAAEEVERNARAARAGGSERVRYCNPSAKRSSRHRKKHSSSIAENRMHGGSLDNLAQQEETCKQRTKKSVSARQKEGGSLPCNVNSSTLMLSSSKYPFLEEARRNKEEIKVKERDILESKSLIENDVLDDITQNCEMMKLPQIRSRANSHDDDQNSHLELGAECRSISASHKILDGKKVDENGNAVQQQQHQQQQQQLQQQNNMKTKKKKALSDKNVVVCDAEKVPGHRSDIINDMEKLISFIENNTNNNNNNNINNNNNKLATKSSSSSSTSSTANTSLQTARKQRAHSTKQTKDHHNHNNSHQTHQNQHTKQDHQQLKKSNSLGEISKTNFDFETKVVLRNNTNTKTNTNPVEKPRERRSWGNMDPLPLQTMYNSAENLESSAEFRVVTKKKKSKKRRSSISGGRISKSSNLHSSSVNSEKVHGRTGRNSPDLRRKSASSVPHSEKSNDSSDADSVHSLPIDTQTMTNKQRIMMNMPISYADMARNNEKIKQQQQVPKDIFVVVMNDSQITTQQQQNNQCVNLNSNNNINNNINKSLVMMKVEQIVVQQQQQQQQQNSCVDLSTNSIKTTTPPDVHNIRNFPAIKQQQFIDLQQQQQQQIVKSGIGMGTTTTQTQTISNKCTKNLNNRQVKNNNNNNNNNKNTVFDHHEYVNHNHHNHLPLDIPDVQTIEKMQLIGAGAGAATLSTTTMTTNCFDVMMNSVVDCDNLSERTNNSNNISSNNNNNNSRPPVVILSGYGKEVPGLVFGFDINEQLLLEDRDCNSCDDFISRYIPPDVYTTTSHNHDKIVNFIGTAWEEAIVNLINGSVQYYAD